MLEKKEERKLTLELITQYENYLLEQERSSATILKYIHGRDQIIFLKNKTNMLPSKTSLLLCR